MVFVSCTISLPAYVSPAVVSSSNTSLSSVPSGGAIVPFWSTKLPVTILTKPEALAPKVLSLLKLI